jgi:cysteine desulfurase
MGHTPSPSSAFYFDAAATVPLCTGALQVLASYTDLFANPASLHPLGYEANEHLERATHQLAGVLGVDAEGIVFTSGATEANNLVIQGVVLQAWQGLTFGNSGNADPLPHVVTSAIEHAAVLEVVDGLVKRGLCRATIVPPNAEGIVPLNAFVEAVEPTTVLASLMQVNNETGAVQPVEAVGRWLKANAPQVFFQSDCVQGLGKRQLPASMPHWLDALTASAHKIGGMKGVGLLYLNPAKRHVVAPLLFGGSQQRGVRPGTVNVLGILTFVASLQERLDTLTETQARLSTMTAWLIEQLQERLPIPFKLNTPSDESQRVSGIINLAFEGLLGDKLVNQLALRGFCVSSGSACHADSVEPSHVLLAMGLSSQWAGGSLRLSLLPTVTQASLEALVEALVQVLNRKTPRKQSHD